MTNSLLLFKKKVNFLLYLKMLFAEVVFVKIGRSSPSQEVQFVVVFLSREPKHFYKCKLKTSQLNKFILSCGPKIMCRMRKYVLKTVHRFFFFHALSSIDL